MNLSQTCNIVSINVVGFFHLGSEMKQAQQGDFLLKVSVGFAQSSLLSLKRKPIHSKQHALICCVGPLVAAAFHDLFCELLAF